MVIKIFKELDISHRTMVIHHFERSTMSKKVLSTNALAYDDPEYSIQEEAFRVMAGNERDDPKGRERMHLMLKNTPLKGSRARMSLYLENGVETDLRKSNLEKCLNTINQCWAKPVAKILFRQASRLPSKDKKTFLSELPSRINNVENEESRAWLIKESLTFSRYKEPIAEIIQLGYSDKTSIVRAAAFYLELNITKNPETMNSRLSSESDSNALSMMQRELKLFSIPYYHGKTFKDDLREHATLQLKSLLSDNDIEVSVEAMRYLSDKYKRTKIDLIPYAISLFPKLSDPERKLSILRLLPAQSELEIETLSLASKDVDSRVRKEAYQKLCNLIVRKQR